MTDSTEETQEAVEIITNNPLDVFGFGSEAVEQVFAEVAENAEKNRDLTICVCGHPTRNHTRNQLLNEDSCQSGKLFCPCLSAYPIIKVPDTRFFMRKTLGNGPKHALSMGIHALASKGSEYANQMEWLVDISCDKCKAEGVKVFPTNVTKQGTIVEDAAALTMLLCEDCLYPTTQAI
jgi:hypothetical protein